MLYVARANMLEVKEGTKKSDNWIPVNYHDMGRAEYEFGAIGKSLSELHRLINDKQEVIVTMFQKDPFYAYPLHILGSSDSVSKVAKEYFKDTHEYFDIHGFVSRNSKTTSPYPGSSSRVCDVGIEINNPAIFSASEAVIKFFQILLSKSKETILTERDTGFTVGEMIHTLYQNKQSGEWVLSKTKVLGQTPDARFITVKQDLNSKKRIRVPVEYVTAVKGTGDG